MIHFGIKDLIDILLVGTMLYYLYTLMRRSRSANLFKGILLFILVWIMVSFIFEMRLLGGILDRVVNVGALALVVLFQEEIRHFFATIGTTMKREFGTFYCRTDVFYNHSFPRHTNNRMPKQMVKILDTKYLMQKSRVAKIYAWCFGETFFYVYKIGWQNTKNVGCFEYVDIVSYGWGR